MRNKFDESSEGGIFLRVARFAGVPSGVLASIEQKLPHWPDQMALLNELISFSAKTPTILLCFDDHVFLRHEGHMSVSATMMTERRSGKRIRGKNEVVDPSANFNCEEVRSIFVMLEALVYKCVHVKLRQQSLSYNPRTEYYDKRLDHLVAAKLLEKDDKALAMELYDTRNQFAHSLLPVRNITYLSETLEDRWGSTGERKSREFKRYFLPDAYRYSEKLLAIFKPVQAQQWLCSDLM